MAKSNSQQNNTYTMAVAPKPSATVEAEANKQLLAAETRRKELARKYAAEEKVSTYLSQMYAPYFGKVMKVSINGVYILFPVDGKSYKVPKSFANEIAARRKAIDAIQSKTNRMSEVVKNFEHAPGDLKLF